MSKPEPEPVPQHPYCTVTSHKLLGFAILSNTHPPATNQKQFPRTPQELITQEEAPAGMYHTLQYAYLVTPCWPELQLQLLYKTYMPGDSAAANEVHGRSQTAGAAHSSAQYRRPAYVLRGNLCCSSGHCTMNLSAILVRYRMVPDRDSFRTRAMLST